MTLKLEIGTVDDMFAWSSRQRRDCTFALLILAAFAGCETNQSVLSVGPVEFAGPTGSAEPNLFANADGRVFLTWHEPLEGERYALRLAVRERGGWSAPTTITESEHFFVNWADFPSFIEMSDGTWLAHWLERVAEATYAYHVRLTLSHDRGTTWSDPITPHRDDSPTEHGFVSMIPWHDGAALVWLDGREMLDPHGSDAGEVERGDMGFQATTISAGGALSAEHLLDARTCECCQTALVVSGGALVAAYRDRSESEVRDIAVTRFEGGEWSEPFHVAEDNWVFPGCPVNGPALAASGGEVVTAWFTGSNGAPAVYLSRSLDGGRAFGSRVRVDDGDPLGRVDIEMLPDGRAVVAWIERTPEAAAVMLRTVDAGGSITESFVVSPTSESRASGFPRVVLSGDDAIVAWTMVGDDGGIRVATVDVSTL